MNCPEHLVFESRFLAIWHIQRADVRRQYVTWGEVLNPLRYEFHFSRSRYAPTALCINKDAKWNRFASNLAWRLWRRKQWERKTGMKASW